ncbi:MAG: GIY-YIG nuclease family protein [Betaproteobacteria bacterium]|nr:GIY-YIG nuclease family protein [Betaproteobacteria bacterium]
MTTAISYQLGIAVKKPIRIRVGRLGHFLFPAGRYVYTGSAKRNLDARIARHLRKEKGLRWHIDWLLSASGVKVVRVKRSREAECILNQKVLGMIVVSGFGASDCRNGCGSHLRYLGNSR